MSTGPGRSPAPQWDQLQRARRVRGGIGWRARVQTLRDLTDTVPPPPPITSFGRLWQFAHRGYRGVLALAFAAVALLAAARLVIAGEWGDVGLTCGLAGLAAWFGARDVWREAERAGLRTVGARDV